MPMSLAETLGHAALVVVNRAVSSAVVWLTRPPLDQPLETFASHLGRALEPYPLDAIKGTRVFRCPKDPGKLVAILPTKDSPEDLFDFARLNGIADVSRSHGIYDDVVARYDDPARGRHNPLVLAIVRSV
jgi:hypothetical protein